MKKEIIVKLHSNFEEMLHTESETGTEFWLARDLQNLLGYSQWRNFVPVIEKGKKSCKNAGFDPSDHFAHVRKMVDLGSKAQREIDAQTYFAVQTRKQEIIERRLAEIERLSARKKLILSEKELPGIIFERLGNGQGFARIRSKGDQALFGGKTTRDMKNKLGVPKNGPLADFLPTITIKAKDFANEITNFNIKRDDLNSEPEITTEHVKNNADVRNVLTNRGIVPEELLAAEDLKKIERQHKSEQKKLPKQVDRLEFINEDIKS
jgi:DNA-damage-inducible protein D